MRRLLLALALVVLTQTAAAAHTAMDVTPWPQGDPTQAQTLLIHVPDPPKGQEYQTPASMLVIPDGYCWRLRTLAFHITTGSGGIKRNVKLVLRDDADTDWNKGRYFVVLALGLQDYTYVDFSAGIGQTAFQGLMGKGSGASYLFHTNVNVGLPDVCYPPGYEWATVSDNRQGGDQYQELYAVVDQEPLT